MAGVTVPCDAPISFHINRSVDDALSFVFLCGPLALFERKLKKVVFKQEIHIVVVA